MQRDKLASLSLRWAGMLKISSLTIALAAEIERNCPSF
jgi:hypothetical protein